MHVLIDELNIVLHYTKQCKQVLVTGLITITEQG